MQNSDDKSHLLKIQLAEESVIYLKIFAINQFLECVLQNSLYK